jgi:hypothetical protein
MPIKLSQIRPPFSRIFEIIGCAVRFRLKRNDAKNKQIFFRFEAKKICFFACFASKQKAGNQKRNENERSENSNKMGTKKPAKINHKKVKIWLFLSCFWSAWTVQLSDLFWSTIRSRNREVHVHYRYCCPICFEAPSGFDILRYFTIFPVSCIRFLIHFRFRENFCYFRNFS